ncbi:peptidase [Marivirga sp. S37H4]|uniref:Peptidase n=1 Tax=Marivirga aurantiaca TaxID=2802615 RepID=A0A934X0H5_9BACT|nr:S41 family peptidase [Marivirga aurantiaca]MBK6266241.1 peptidase [Marivirga aurantiaca]
MKALQLISLLVLLSVLTACKKEDPEPVYEAGSNEYVNDWIYGEMSTYYYWNKELPAKNITGISPDDYFYQLISSKDRFSWIQPNFIELLNSLQGVSKEAGYEFILYNNPNIENGVIGQISYVKKNSPASENDLKRGDLFTKINGTELTVSNYSTLLGGISENHTLTLQRYNEATETFENLGVQEFTTVNFAENPHYLDTVYTRNGKKIGYYVYNFFATGPNSSDTQYLQEMDAIFEKFKSEGIQHLVLDLRYNSGGAESATINLASLVGTNISPEDIFVKRDYNEELKEALIEEYGQEVLNKKFTQKAANIGNILQSPQLTVLSSSRTASASELLINGLSPFMDILIIGDTTVGKNVGSISIYEENKPENTWGMQPIITKSFNSEDQSDYDMGFYPDIPKKDNSLIVKALGDQQELLLSEALNYLAGDDLPALKTSSPLLPAKDIYSSIEQKRRFGIYNIDAIDLLNQEKSPYD